MWALVCPALSQQEWLTFLSTAAGGRKANMISEQRTADQAGGTYGSSEAAAGWQRSGVARAQILAPLTDRMLDLAGVDIGHRVLDVAAGTGEQTLLAARRVGPTGAVVATDIAARMLALTEEAATRAGLRNVETQFWMLATLTSSSPRHSTPRSCGWHSCWSQSARG